jgi:chromosome partitioning protein
MAGNKSPKTIATINFKGGVGKTTVTWCLADTLSTYSNATVLMFDLDAQMSLTQAVGLNEDSGSLYPAFGAWYDKSVNGRRTIFDAIDQYTKPATHFDFPVAYDFIYQISKTLHFVPSVEELYWLELEVFHRDQMKDFMRRLLGKIEHSGKIADYDYVLFDCPPSFTLLSYSVLSCCDLVLSLRPRDRLRQHPFLLQASIDRRSGFGQRIIAHKRNERGGDGVVVVASRRHADARRRLR